jgi:hypothetical protein
MAVRIDQVGHTWRSAPVESPPFAAVLAGRVESRGGALRLS